MPGLDRRVALLLCLSQLALLPPRVWAQRGRVWIQAAPGAQPVPSSSATPQRQDELSERLSGLFFLQRALSATHTEGDRNQQPPSALVRLGMVDAPSLTETILGRADGAFTRRAAWLVTDEPHALALLRNAPEDDLRATYFSCGLESEEAADRCISHPQALRMLGPEGLVASAPSLIRALRKEARLELINAIGRSGDRSAIPALLPLLEDSRSSIRQAVIAWLGALQAEEARPKLLEIAAGRGADAEASLVALSEIGDPRDVAFLLQSIEAGESPRARMILLNLLRVDEAQAIPLATRWAQSPSSVQRGSAIFALTHVALTPALAPLIAGAVDAGHLPPYRLMGHPAGLHYLVEHVTSLLQQPPAPAFNGLIEGPDEEPGEEERVLRDPFGDVAVRPSRVAVEVPEADASLTQQAIHILARALAAWPDALDHEEARALILEHGDLFARAFAGFTEADAALATKVEDPSFDLTYAIANIPNWEAWSATRAAISTQLQAALMATPLADPIAHREGHVRSLLWVCAVRGGCALPTPQWSRLLEAGYPLAPLVLAQRMGDWRQTDLPRALVEQFRRTLRAQLFQQDAQRRAGIAAMSLALIHDTEATPTMMYALVRVPGSLSIGIARGLAALASAIDARNRGRLRRLSRTEIDPEVAQLLVRAGRGLRTPIPEGIALSELL